MSSSLAAQFKTASPAMQTTKVKPPAMATLAKSSNDPQAMAVTKAVAMIEKISIDRRDEKGFFSAISSLLSIRR